MSNLTGYMVTGAPQQVAAGTKPLVEMGVKRSYSEGNRENELTAYAGLGLVRMQQARAKWLSPQQRTDLLNEASRLREQVMAGDAESFEPNSLSKNWLWPEKAIGDWRSLQKM